MIWYELKERASSYLFQIGVKQLGVLLRYAHTCILRIISDSYCVVLQVYAHLLGHVQQPYDERQKEV